MKLLWSLILLSAFIFTPNFSIGQQQFGGVPEFLLKDKSQLKSSPITLDLKEEIRSFRQKSKSSDEEAFEALPILNNKASTQKKDLNKLIAGKKNTIQSIKITLAPGEESYMRFGSFAMPQGSRLFLISMENNKVLGAYTEKNNLETGNFMAGPLKGDILIEYHAPGGEAVDQLPFQLEEVYVRPVFRGVNELGFGAAYACQINVNCNAGANYASSKNGVMRIRMVATQGIALCTGTLLNNTAQDEKRYVLTAFHCLRPPGEPLEPLYDMWSFDFAYESNSCANPAEEPGIVSVQGARKLAEWADTDMMLLEITKVIPESANAYFNGWDRRLDHAPNKSVIIHHPGGDIKKITSDFDKIGIHNSVTNWNNGTSTPVGSHYINDFDDAVYQPGSSGSPLFDDSGKVIGQLHGGPLSDKFCSIGIGYSGRLSLSWDSGPDNTKRLKDWLDPGNTGATNVVGKKASASEQKVRFIGKVTTSDGIAIPNAEVFLSGDEAASFFTGNDGRFVFEDLSTKGRYDIKLTKNTNAANGLSALDLVMMINHILDKKPLPSIFSKLSADVNQDGNISSSDLVQIRSIIIGKTTAFPNSSSWKFEPGLIEMMPGNVGAGSVEVQIVGYKMGDVNNSANPRL